MSKRTITVEVDETTYLLVAASIADSGLTIEAYAARLLEIAASEYRDIQGLVEAKDD